MKAITLALPAIGTKPIEPKIRVIIPLKKRKIKKDIVLNVDIKNALIRVGISLVLAIVPVYTNTHLILYVSPVVFYLFVSALTKFCVVKYVWRRYIKHDPPVVPSAYGKNLNYPEESV